MRRARPPRTPCASDACPGSRVCPPPRRADFRPSRGPWGPQLDASAGRIFERGRCRQTFSPRRSDYHAEGVKLLAYVHPRTCSRSSPISRAPPPRVPDAHLTPVFSLPPSSLSCGISRVREASTRMYLIFKLPNGGTSSSEHPRGVGPHAGGARHHPHRQRAGRHTENFHEETRVHLPALSRTVEAGDMNSTRRAKVLRATLRVR